MFITNSISEQHMEMIPLNLDKDWSTVCSVNYLLLVIKVKPFLFLFVSCKIFHQNLHNKIVNDFQHLCLCLTEKQHFKHKGYKIHNFMHLYNLYFIFHIKSLILNLNPCCVNVWVCMWCTIDLESETKKTKKFMD